MVLNPMESNQSAINRRLPKISGGSGDGNVGKDAVISLGGVCVVGI